MRIPHSMDRREGVPESLRQAKTLGDLPTPALILDVDILERNLRAMAQRLADAGMALRPHFKTHKCLHIARLQQDLGARGFTVSTLEEMERLTEAGFHDLTWAFPLILNRAPQIARLLGRAQRARLHWVADSLDAVSTLETEVATASSSHGPLRVWLKVDCGYHRAGVDPESDLAVTLARHVARSDRLNFEGILSHSGHGYFAPGRERLRAVHHEERQVMIRFADRLRAEDLDVPGISIGSTPTLSATGEPGDFDGLTEARPGNYVFYDFTQVELGACRVADCALTVMASVVSCRESAENCVIDAGALTLSKDQGPEWVTSPTYGEIFCDYAHAALNPDIRVISLSQEHGKVNAPLPVGTRLRILPNHSCLVVPNFRHYVVARGEEIVDFWPIFHRTWAP